MGDLNYRLEAKRDHVMEHLKASRVLMCISTASLPILPDPKTVSF